MTTNVNISEAEYKVIDVLWSNGPMTAEQVADALSKTSDWRFPTIKTLLGRLLKKQVVSAHPEGRRFVYSPSITREAYTAGESQRFVERLFDGKISPLVSQFSAARGLSREDIDALRRILDELE